MVDAQSCVSVTWGQGWRHPRTVRMRASISQLSCKTENNRTTASVVTESALAMNESRRLYMMPGYTTLFWKGVETDVKNINHQTDEEINRVEVFVEQEI